MGVFTRFRDVINSNINAMLERAEDPEKLMQLISKEMEDTLVAIKTACAGAMAARRKIERDSATASDKVALWSYRAQLAVDKGRDDLAREALTEKRRWRETADALARELEQCVSIVEQYQSDIKTLESKLASLRDKQRALMQKRYQQRPPQNRRPKRQLPPDLPKDISETIARFDYMRDRVDRITAADEVARLGRRPTLEEKFAELERQANLEAEFDELKRTTRQTHAGAVA
jgi:phage shock protein A